MTHIASGQETAANLTSFGAVISDPSSGVVYRAGSQDISQGFVQLTLDDHSRKMQIHKASLNRYAALKAIPAQAGKGLNRYAALRNNRASLRLSHQPLAKAAPRAAAKPVMAAPTKTISVGQLAMKKPEPKRPDLKSRMSYWAQAAGAIPNLMAI